MNDELMQNLLAIKADKDTNLLPENLKKGITCLGIDGTLEASSGAVKLFETEKEMQADTTAKDGDLAVVYRNEIQNMTAETETQYITFPETVTLPEAFTDSVFTMLRAVDESTMFDGQVTLDPNMFRFNSYTETGMIRVSYSSSDGVTYTREQFMGNSGDLTNPVDLGTVIHCELSEEWNNNLGYFMQIGGSTFDGLYKYGTYTDNYILNSPLVSNPDSYLIMNVNNTPITQFSGITIVKETKLSSDKLTHIPVTYDIYKCPNLEVRGIINNGGQYLLGFMVYQRTGSENSYTYQKYEYVNSELTQTSEVTSTNKLPYFDVSREDSADSVTTYIELTGTEYVVCGFEGNIKSIKFYTSEIKKSLPTGILIDDDTDYSSKLIEISKSELAYYKLAENQYNLKSSNQLLPEVIAYGKNGNIIGDGSIYDNLDWENIMVSYNLLSDDAGRIIPYDNLTQTIISYDTNVSGYSKNCKTRGVKYTKSNFVTIDEDVTSTIVGTSSIRINKNELYYFAGRKKTVDNDTIYTIEITRYKVENGKLHISLYDSQNIENGTFAYITSISGSSLTLGDYAIKYNPNDNCIYYVFLDDSKYANFVKYDIENKNFTKLFKTSIAYTYGKWNIDFNNQMVYVDSSTSNSFDSYTFSGTKKTIQSHKGYSSSLCCSDIYIGVKNGSNSNAILYNMLTKSFTSITIPTQSGWVLYTYDDITYVIYRDENGVYKYMIIKNDSVISTSDVDNTYNIGTSVPNTIIPSSGRFYGNAANLIFDDKLLMLPYSIIDVQNNIVYAIQNMPYTILLYLYMDTEKFNWVYANEQYISYRQSINCYSDGNGKYLAILLYGSDYTPCKAQDTYLDTHYVLNDYEDTISPDEYNTALNTAKQIEGGVE